MIYEFMCQGACKKISTVGIKLEEYDIVKRNIKCCGLPMERYFSTPPMGFVRAPFPAGTAIVEHAMDEPVHCRDKKQLEDICAESNTVSRFLEDDV